MKKQLAILTLAMLALQACTLEEKMVSSGSRELVFGSSSGLEAYSLSFYNQLPSLGDLSSAEGTRADYLAAKSINSFYCEGYSPEGVTSWSWSSLRAINFLIDGIHSEDCTVPQEDKDHYEGIARWFRARFYLAKLQKYSGKVIAFNFDGFYEPLKALLDHYVSLGMLDTASRELILFPQTVDELVGLLK